MTAQCAAVLRAARKRIEQGWTRLTQARSAALGFVSVEVDHPTASAWCLTGALRIGAMDAQILKTDRWEVNKEAAAVLAGAMHPPFGRSTDPVYAVIEWNDAWGRTQTEVQALFDRVGVRHDASE